MGSVLLPVGTRYLPACLEVLAGIPPPHRGQG